MAMNKQDIALARARLNAMPFDPAAMLDNTAALGENGHYAASYHIAQRLVEIAPSADAYCNLAATQMLLASCAQSDEWLYAARDSTLKALEIKPGYQPAQNQLALVALELGEIVGAEKLARTCLEQQPDDPHLARVLAHALFAQGKWGEGFDRYVGTVGLKGREIEFRYVGLPQWKGETGGRLLVLGEQGLGEEVSFASMIADAAIDNEVTLVCDSRLAGLFSRSLPGTVNGDRWSQVTTVEAFSAPKHDYYTLAAGLGKVYRRTREAFPRTSFLVADPERRAAMRARLDALPGKKVGIAWTGGKPPAYLYRRWLPRPYLAELLDVPGVTWISLEYRKSEMPDGVHHWPEIVEAPDYDETAALVAELDEVVTVTTAVAHLCGALGKRAHVLVNEAPRWFYGLEGSRHDWYDSLVLHRQSRVDGELRWDIDAVKEAIKP